MSFIVTYKVIWSFSTIEYGTLKSDSSFIHFILLYDFDSVMLM